MNKTLYIIPAWRDSCSDEPYQQLADVARGKGYEVVCIDVDWKKPLTQQIFDVPENAVIFGFSLGAILAWLVAQRHPCEHLILASMTLHQSFTDPDDKQALIDLAGSEFVEDITANLHPSNKARRQTVMYGELEGGAGDIIVPNTEHELADDYIQEITKLL